MTLKLCSVFELPTCCQNSPLKNKSEFQSITRSSLFMLYYYTHHHHLRNSFQKINTLQKTMWKNKKIIVKSI